MSIRKGESTRNPYIELCRFIAAVVMLFHHTEKLGGYSIFGAYRIALGGWVFVEYFFILSGYFMTRHFEIYNNRGHDAPERIAVTYTTKKLLRIMPYAAAGIVLDTVAQIGCGDIEIANIGNLVAELPLHFVMLKGLNIVKYDINAPLWFLTGVLIIMPILVTILLRFHDFYKYLASWLLPLLIYTVIFAVNGNIQYWGDGWSINCLLRAFAGLTLGSLAFYVSEYLKMQEYTQSMKILLSTLEVVLFIALVLLSFIDDCLSYSIPCVFFSFITLCIAFSGKDCVQAHIPYQVAYLGKLSMPLYCLHRPIYDLVRWLCEGLTFNSKLWIGIIASFILSALMISIVEGISEKGMRRSHQA